MIAKSQADLKAYTPQAEMRSFQDARTSKAFMECGDKSGRGFSFIDGDIFEVPSLEEIYLRMKDITLAEKKRNLLYFSAKVSAGWTWVPVWALRKKTPSQADETPALREHSLYQQILHCDCDVSRVELLAGKTWKVRESVVTLTDPKTSKPYDLRIWTVEEVKKSGRRN